MKLTQEAKVFESNAIVVSQEFKIGDTGKIIEILRNKLYRHKVRTLVQEYMSNARDAMREVGSSERIHVVLPTTFDPVFKVRDFGPGISPDRIANVFIQYGSSTKDKDNNQTGGFGIGAKSAWSYTESFTIVTFIDGVQRSYVAHIGANNNGRLDYLGEVPTTEKNGSEIQIAVQPKDIAEFKSSAFRAAYFWKEEEQPDFLNAGSEKRQSHTEGVRINDLEVLESQLVPSFIMSSWDNGIIIIIDGIPYVAGPSLVDKIAPMKELTTLVKGRLLMHFNTGEIEVSASREEIADSQHSINHLTVIAENVLKDVNATIAAEFKKATTPFEHFQTYKTLSKGYVLNNYRKFGDFTINSNGALESDLFHSVKVERCALVGMDDKLEKSQLGYGRRNYYSRVQLVEESFDKLYYVDTDETALVLNNRLRTLLVNATENFCVVFTKKDTLEADFKKVIKALGAEPLSDFEPMKKERKTRETIKVERAKQSFAIHNQDRYSHQVEYTTLADNTQKWLYIDLDKKSLTYTELSSYLSKRFGRKICALGKDSMRRVKGDPNFQSLESFLKTVKPDTDDIESLKWLAAKNTSMMNKLKPAKGIKDKFLTKMMDQYADLKQKREVPDLLKKQYGSIREVEAFKFDDEKLTTELKTRWSLLGKLYIENHMLPELVEYINAK